MAPAEARSQRRILTAAAALAFASVAAAEDTKPAAAKPSDLAAAIDSTIGAPVHGDLTVHYRLRNADDATDQDLYEYLNLRVADESRDRVSATFFVRAASDLDHAHEDQHGATFKSLDDVFDSSVNALLYTAYVTIRPATGPVETVRLGRQYVYAAETFHMDGVSATTHPAQNASHLTLTGYAGVPVHFYESSPHGDWLVGLRGEADPWKDGSVALDYTHVEDDLSLLSEKPENDLAAVSVGQRVSKPIDLYGQFTWLDGPRDATVRATGSWPDDRFLVQASYYRLLERQEELATEFDPYTNVIQALERYHQADLRVSKGFGDHFDVEVGAALRKLLSGEAESKFNRDTTRIFVTPSVTDLPWQGTTASLTGESYSGNGEELRTWGFDVSHRFKGSLEISAGSDYALYGFGSDATHERTHVRTAYAGAKFDLTRSLHADIRYTWERDDAETFHVLTMALVLTF